jgi:hypothetical protein
LLGLAAGETRKLGEEAFVFPHGAIDFEDDVAGLPVDLLLREGGRERGREGG